MDVHKGLKVENIRVFKKYLRENIDKSGLSIQELSRQSGVTAGYISRLTKLDNLLVPSVETIKKLSKSLKIDYLESMKIIGYIEDNPPSPDLYQLLLANLVSIRGKCIKDIKQSQELVDIIKKVLGNDDIKIKKNSTRSNLIILHKGT